MLDVFSDLPEWKRAALSAVRYGQYVVAPIVVAAPGVDCPPPGAAPFRREIGTNWIYGRPYQMSPAPIDQNGGFFTSIATDADARRIWEDDDESIKSGVAHVFTGLYPKLAHRILHMDVKRWEHGLPQLRLGYMSQLADLQKPVGNVAFCGDYTHPLAHTDSANRTRAAGSGRSARHDLTFDMAGPGGRRRGDAGHSLVPAIETSDRVGMPRSRYAPSSSAATAKIFCASPTAMKWPPPLTSCHTAPGIASATRLLIGSGTR